MDDSTVTGTSVPAETEPPEPPSAPGLSARIVCGVAIGVGLLASLAWAGFLVYAAAEILFEVVI